MTTKTSTGRWPPAAACLTLCAAMALGSGCADQSSAVMATADTDTASESSATPDAQTLANLLDEVLADELELRAMDLQRNAAWQIMHGILVYQDQFPVPRPDAPEQKISALKYLLDGGTCRGWDAEPVVFDNYRGLRFVLDVENKTGAGLGSMRGQGHPDQWLAILSQAHLPLEQTIRVANETFTIADLVRQTQQDVPSNFQEEYSWTLIGLTAYLPTSSTWKAADGQLWSISRLAGIEAEQELHGAACGGTHRLIGLATALHRHRLQHGGFDNNWQRAQEVVEQAISKSHELQNSDGSLSAQYLLRPGWTPDLVQNLGCTGHMLEFLAIAQSAEQLQEPWMRRAVANLCQTVVAARDEPLECGALYHALHGLALYRERAYPVQGEPRYLLDGPGPQ